MKRIQPRRLAAAILATAGVGLTGAWPAAASDAKVPFTAPQARAAVLASVSAVSKVFLFEGRIVTLHRNPDGTHKLAITRARPGDLVALTDRAGRMWIAEVRPGETSAETPWVARAVRGKARTVDGKEISFPVP